MCKMLCILLWFSVLLLVIKKYLLFFVYFWVLCIVIEIMVDIEVLRVVCIVVDGSEYSERVFDCK